MVGGAGTVVTAPLVDGPLLVGATVVSADDEDDVVPALTADARLLLSISMSHGTEPSRHALKAPTPMFGAALPCRVTTSRQGSLPLIASRDSPATPDETR